MWTRFQHIDETDTEEIKNEKRFYNSILLDRYPYFFIYRYNECKKEYREYVERVEITCQQKFRMTLSELQEQYELTDEQSEFVENYYKYMPVIISDSPMNMMCRRIEKLNALVSKKTRVDEFDYSILKFADVDYKPEDYKRVIGLIKKYMNARKDAAIDSDDTVGSNSYDTLCETAERELLSALPDVRATVNVLIDYFYRDNPSKSRDILWGTFGKYIVRNLTEDTISVPLPDPNGNIEYLGERYSETEIKL